MNNQFLTTILLGIIGPQEIIVILSIVAIFFVASLIPLIFFLLTLQNTLNAISFENRKMQPGEVWLTLIPLFGMIWQFFIVTRMAESLKAEFEKRGIRTEEELPGKSLGIAYAVLYCCSIVPFLGYLTAIGGLICWIMYWVKINEYKNRLLANSGN